MQKSPSAASPRFPLAFEALESRVLYDAVADVKVSVVEEQFINEDVTFQIDFDNTGDATGYAPYVDFIAPPELAIKGVVVAGAPALNPDGSSVTPIGQIAADGQLVGITSGLPVDHPMFKNPSDGGSYGLAGSATAPVLYDTAGNPDLVGMYVYSVQLPFGSFTEGNPPASVSVTTSLDKSNGIIPHQEVVAYAQGGFAYGSDALHNPATDFPIASGLDSDGVTPLVIDLNKDASVPEMDGPYTGENASGPNHQITYSLTVRLADGEEVNNLVIQDFLPDDLAFSGNLTVTFGSGTGGSKNLSIEDEPELNTDGVTGTDPANNRLRLTVDNIIGSGGNDITVTYTAFVPYKEADGTLVVNAVTGEQNDLADDEYNDASVTADYDRDGAGPAPTLVIGDDEGPMNPFTTLQSFDSDTDFRIEEHSIATQKDVAIAPGGDRGVIGTLNSSDVLEYTINFQISDYFAFTDVVFDDVMGDGQEFLPALDPSSTWFNAGDFSQDPEEIRPEVTFTMHGASITVAFDEANFSAIEHPDGSTSIHFNVYQQLVDSGFLVSGDPMLGGFIAPSGTAPADLGPLNFDGGPTTGTIRYRALTRESFTTGGQPQISQGDSLSNTVVVTGLNRDIETFAPLVDVTDDSSSSIDIPVGIPVKETVNIYSHGQMISLVDDNDESTPPAVAVAPGDLITYRILYTLPISEYENLKFTDFLPMPIFDVDGPGSLALDTSGIYSYDPVATYQTPGRISYGPNGTFFGGDGPGGSQGIEFDNPGYNSTAGITPVITVDDHLNSFTIDFGDYDLGDGNEAVATTIELFITMQVKDAQFADGLFFTNQILVDESSTIGSQSSTNEISQNILSTPELAITKGIAAVTHDDGVFSAATGPAGIVFTPPGSATAWTGANINSTALAATPIDANLSNVDAGDLITFVIVVENTGTSSWGAFDVSINDTIPAGLTIPGGGANLRVTDGNGNPMAYTGDLFTTPLELTDPSQSQGSLTRYDATSGTNLVVIAYDLLVENSVTAAETLTNVAEVESYAASEGGADFADPGDLSDVASVTIALPATEKIILDTSHDDANNLDANREVAIGEVVTYQVSFTLPEGTLNNLRITDSLPTGMAFVGLDSVVLSSSDLSSTDGDVNDIVAFFNSGASTLELGYGTSGSPGLGSWLNSSTDNSVAETITITYRAVVLNAVSNDRDDTLTNAATLEWEVSGASQTVSDSESVVILEPDLMITKSVVGSITGVEGAQEITYLIRVENLVADPTHPNRSEAYNVRLSDLLPDDVSYVISALASGAAPDSGIDFDSLVGASGEISASWDRLAPGEFSEISVTVRIDDGLPTDTVITNNASVEYTSLPGSQGDSGFTGFDPGSIDPSLAFGTGALNANLNSSDPIFDSANERTGNPADDGGVANDYTASAPASVTVINPVGIDKAIIDTAEAHTSQDASTAGPVSAAIGEVVRFEVRVRLPQVASSQLQLVDTLDAGLFWIDASTNLLDIRLEGFSNPANLVASNALIPAADGLTHPLDASLVSYDSLNNQVTFNLGDFTNLETDAGDEFLIIGYNVIVRNDSGVARGDTLVNSVQLREGGFDLGSPFSSSLTVVEPVLTVAKSDGGVTTADAGDLINYTLTVTASNAANTTTAFELLITDSVPAALEIVGGVISISGLPGSSSVLRSTVSGQDISVLVDRLKPGETFQISYQARVRDAGADVIQAGETVLNTADLTYTSLPDDGTDNGSGDNTTGNEAGLPDTESGERIFSTSGSDGFTAVAPVLTKVLGNPADTAFTVGEAVEYVITLELPEGRTGNPMAYVLDTIDPGFRFLPGTLQVTVGSGIAVGTSGILDEVNTNFFTFTDPGDSALSELLRFDFGFIDFESGTAGDGLHKGTIEIRYQLQVENILAIQAGDSLNNTADLFYTNHDGVTTDLLSDTDDADTIITVVEPQVDVTKSIDNISSPDAGGIVSYRIVLDHPGDTIADFNTGAYDITITDTLPVDVAMQPGTFTAFLNGVTDVSSWFSVMATGFTDNGFGQIDLAPGDQIVVTYDATISVAVTDGELLINEVDIEWTSLDAGNLSDGIDAVDTGERTGSGTGPNDYAGSDTATVTANLTPAYSLTKAVVATTADHTGTAAGTNASMTDLVIGEMVTYQITAQMGRGTTNGVVIEDFLALTNGILDIRDVRIEYGSALTLTVPSAVISDSNTDSFKDQVSLTFGTVVNYPSGSSGPADEQIRIFVDAVVVNVSANQGGDVIANTGQLTVLEDTDNDGAADDIVVRTSSVSVEIVEPALTVDKMITSVPANPDAGDIVSYQIVVSNNSGVDAFEATFSDMVPAGLDLLTGTFAAVRTVGGADVTSWFTVTANSIDQIGTFNLATGDSITITYNAEILTTVTDGERLVNSATTTWTSLESADLTDGSDTGDTEERTGSGTGPNDYAESDTAMVTANLTPVYDFSKSVFSTSASHTGSAYGTDPSIEDLVIGETVTYQLTAQMGRGTTNGVVIEDLLALTNGLLDIRDVRIEIGSALTVTLPIPTLTDSNLDSFIDQVLLNFGTVVNDPASSTGPADEQIRVFIDAVVVNVLENQDGDIINNAASLTLLEDTDNDGSADDTVLRTANVDVEIVEPAVSVAKSISNIPANPDATDTVSYQIVINNTGDIDAFDVTFSDTLPAQMSLATATFTALRDSDNVDVSAWFSVTTSGIVEAAGGFDLAAGDFITLTYDATLLATVTDGQLLTNTADIEWTSVDGTINPDERTGDGTGPNDYNDSDSQTVTATLTPVYDFSKSVFSTSASHTGSAYGTDPSIEDLVIGETVTYQLTAQMGRGTTNGVVIEDLLALTNGLLDIRDVRIEIGSALTVTLPIPTLTDSNLDSFIDQVLLNFGTVVNDPASSTGPADEQIRVFIDAVVVNVLENQDGDIINNAASLTLLEDTDNDGSADDTVIRTANVDVEIVEPSVSVAKSITSIPANPDAGDTVSYQIVITNTGDIDAFDVTFLDRLPSKVRMEAGSFTAIRFSDSGDVSGFFTLNAAGLGTDTIRERGFGFTLAANDSITLTYDVTIGETVFDGERQTNDADLEWTSTSGSNADERGGDGDPDQVADPLDPNDYETEDGTTFVPNLLGYSFDKSIFSTSLDHTEADSGTDPAITDLTIGETVTYALTATFAEGSTPNVVIADIIDTTQGILSIETITIVAGDNISSSRGSMDTLVRTLGDLNFDGYTDSFSIDFGTVVNNALNSADPEADRITVYVTARVVNVLANQNGDMIHNDATLTYREDLNDDGIIDDSDGDTVLTDSEDVELVEPAVTIDKAVNNPTPKLNEVLTYTLTITNDNTLGNADAFEISILDRLPVGLTVEPGTVTLNILGSPAHLSTIISDTSDSRNLRLVLDRLDEGESVEIVYQARVTSDIAFYRAVLPNTADIEWTSAEGTVTDERGGDGDPDNAADPSDPNDYEHGDDESVEVHQPDLRIVKDDGGVSIFPGQAVTYTITMTNQGRATALDVHITDDISYYLSNGFTLVEASDGGTLSGGKVRWNLPDMLVNDQVTVSLTLRAPSVIPAGLEVVTNTAVAHHLDIDPTPPDNTEDEDTPIAARPDLTVTKDDHLTYANVGDTVTYTIVYDNVGNQVASGVVITDTLPPGVEFISATHGGRLRGGRVIWEIDTLRPHDGSTVEVTVRILTAGLKVNTVVIEDDGSGGPDPTPENNHDADQTISKTGFRYDSNQNFLFDRGNLQKPTLGFDGWRDQLVRWFPEHEMIRNSQVPVVLATHMNSGLAQPGSTITLEVYNARGELIAEQSVIADTGGNWLATFSTDNVNEQPSRIVMKQTWTSANPFDQTGYNYRTYFAPAFSTATYYTEELSVWNVTGKRQATEVLDLFDSCECVLKMDWNNTTYEFSARGALQSSSGN